MMNLVESLKNALQEQVVVEAVEETITDEQSFREFAKAKFEEVFGDELDVERMNQVIDGLIDDNQEAVENGNWIELVGMLNKSFGS